jgi:hypothetical protein
MDKLVSNPPIYDGSDECSMTDPPKRFSLRHGKEAEPSQAIFEDAPQRLRYFVLEYLRNIFYGNAALELVGRVLCHPELIVSGTARARP